MEADREELASIDGVGEVIAAAFTDYMADAQNRERLRKLAGELELEIPEENTEPQILNGFSFVVTGTLQHYENRDALKAVIESLGGKVTGSVTGKTECLINNDVNSSSTKSKKAKELKIPILSEEDFIQKYLGGNSHAD